MARLRAAGCVFAEAEADLICEAATTTQSRDELVDRRATGEPLEYVLGWAEFNGIRVEVAPGVFVPRHRSGFLVEQAIARTPPGATVVDLCCGTGALGLVIANEVTGIRLYASDLDPAAVACASRNVEPAGGTVVEGDLFDGLPGDLRGHVDTLIVNAPYVPTGEIRLMPVEARVHEHPIALDGGVDGLSVHRRVASVAIDWLAHGGWLLVETSSGQSAALAEDFTRNGLTASVLTDDAWDGAVVVGLKSSRETGQSASGVDLAH